MTRVLAMLLTLLLWGCSRVPAAPAAPRELRIAQITSCITLDPHRHDSVYTSGTLGHFYGRLVNFGPNLELVPELAVRWENPAETLWRLHLRDGVVFHDGRPFEAEDVVATIERARAPESHLRHYVQRIRQARAAGRLTVELVTEGAAPVLLNGLAFVMIVPRNAGTAEITHPVGTGPYVFLGGAAGGSVLGARFDRYWEGRPAFEKLAILTMPDDAERARAISENRADVVAQFPLRGFASAKQDPRVHLVSRPGLGVDFLSFSFAPGSPFADRRVREAVALAIDREAVVKSALHGLGTPAWQLVPPTVFGYVPGVEHPPRDLARARRLLAEAGHPRGLSSRLVVSQRVEAMGREVARQLAEIGLHLAVEVQSHHEFYASALQDMPMAIDAYSAATGDAANFLEAELHSRRGGLGTFATSGYHNPKLDALIEKAGTILDPKRRTDVLQEALRLVMDEKPLVPLATRPDLYAFRRGVSWEIRHMRLNAADLKAAPTSR